MRFESFFSLLILIKEMNLQNLAEEIRKSGGVSYSLTYGSLQGKKGYCVSPYKAQEIQIPLKEFDWVDIQSFCSENAELLAEDNHFLGAWVDHDIVYLDVSVLMTRKADALKKANECNQLAIYSLTDGKVIEL